MRRVWISQIAELGDKEIIPCLLGTCTVVGKVYAGTARTGKPYHLQTITLRDDTGTIEVKVDGHEADYSGLLNKQVLVESKEGDKGMSGVYAADDEYKGTVTRKVRVTPSGKVLEAGEATAQPAPAPAPAQRATQPPVRPATAPAAAPTPAASASPVPAPVKPSDPAPGASQGNPGGHAPDLELRIKQAEKMAFAKANIYLVAIRAGHWVNAQVREAHLPPMSEGQLQACMSSIFISLDRKDC